MKVVVVGGVAGGMSFAARARRLCESCEIVVIEQGPYVSFANCGLPYYLSGEISDRDSLLLHTPESLEASLALDVRVNARVEHVDRERKLVRVANTSTGDTYEETYDKLVLSTGAIAFVPPFDGPASERVHTLRTIPDVDALRARVDELAENGGRAVVLGAGFIGLEVVEALCHRNIPVDLVELSGQVLPPLDVEMAQLVQEELERNGVVVHTGVSVQSFVELSDGLSVTLTTGAVIEAGAIIVGVGVRAESKLARAAGLELDERGAIVTDDNQLTSDPDIYAVGDVVEVIDEVTGKPSVVPLAGPANRQGRMAANHLFTGDAQRTPVLATAIVRVFDLVAATTGQNEKSLRRDGVAHHVVHLHPNHHAGYFPGAKPIHLKLLFAPDGNILGAQAVGEEGVDKRIDVLATAIRGDMTVADLAELELAYAPPFGSAKDPVNMAGFMAENVLSGVLQQWSGDDVESLPEDVFLLDVRTPREFASGHLPGAVNISHTDVRDRIGEVPKNRPVYVYCASGFRSYLVSRLLAQSDFEHVRTLDGGLMTLRTQKRIEEVVEDEG